MSHMKTRNGQISPRDRDMNNSSGYSNYHHYSTQSHNNSSSSSYNNSHHQSSHPNSDLINFVHGAWKEKSSSEVFKLPETSEKLSHFDFDGWIRNRQQHKAT